MTGAPDAASVARRPEVAVGAVAVAGDRLLLVRRARQPEAGRWSLPGGRVEPGEPVRHAVERELLEETGLTGRCDGFLGWVERIGPAHHFLILDFSVTVAGGSGTTPTPGTDAAEARWVPLAEVAALPLVSGLEAFLREHAVLPGDAGPAQR